MEKLLTLIQTPQFLIAMAIVCIGICFYTLYEFIHALKYKKIRAHAWLYGVIHHHTWTSYIKKTDEPVIFWILLLCYLLVFVLTLLTSTYLILS